MIDLEGVVLAKLLKETSDIEHLARIKMSFFSEMYTPIYRAIHALYIKTGEVPTFESLEVTIKDAKLQNNIAALKSMDLPDVDIDLVIEGLVDKFAQTEALNSIDGFLDKVTFMDTHDIKEALSSIVLDLDSKLHTDESIIFADQVYLFESLEDKEVERVYTGISNEYDATLGGMHNGELILLGGKRGSGKSIVCANLVRAQYEAGKISVYYTIEMSYQETLGRILCILADVSYSSYRLGSTTLEEEIKLVKTRAGMFIDADDLVEKFIRSPVKDMPAFEKELVKTKQLNQEVQIIVVDDRDLSVAAVDLTMQKFRAMYGDKLSLVVIDYLNQLVLDGASDMYDWKEQINISKQLKNLARKYNVPIVSPYQIDEEGKTRFSKGVLDACDVAIQLIADEDSITLKAVKVRSSSDQFAFKQPMEWRSLRMNPATIPVEEVQREEEDEATVSNLTKARFKSEDDI